MGQKVNPIGLRLGVNKTWKSKWYVDPREYSATLHEDLKIKKALFDSPEVQGAEIADVEIVRKPQRISLTIATSRPGIIIGAKGSNVEKLGTRLQSITDKKVQIKIKQIDKPDMDAQIVAQNVARQLTNRGSHRRALKMAISKAMQAGAQGIKIKVSGRLGGKEIAGSEWLKDGRIPLHTLRSDIDYGFAQANTTFGVIGVKVWVYNGEILSKSKKDDAGLLVRKSAREKAASAGNRS